MSTLRSNIKSPQWDKLKIRRLKVGPEGVCGARLQAVTRLNSRTVHAASVATPWTNSASCSPSCSTDSGRQTLGAAQKPFKTRRVLLLHTDLSRCSSPSPLWSRRKLPALRSAERCNTLLLLHPIQQIQHVFHIQQAFVLLNKSAAAQWRLQVIICFKKHSVRYSYLLKTDAVTLVNMKTPEETASSTGDRIHLPAHPPLINNTAYLVSLTCTKHYVLKHSVALLQVLYARRFTTTARFTHQLLYKLNKWELIFELWGWDVCLRRRNTSSLLCGTISLTGAKQSLLNLTNTVCYCILVFQLCLGPCSSSGCSKRLWRKMADGCHGGGTLWAWRAWRRVTVVLLCVCHTTLAILPKVEEFLQSFSLLTSLEQFLFHNNDHTGNRAALLLLCSNHISFTSGSRTLQCFLTVSWGVFAAGAALLEKHSG